jgi:hypothetical protein
MHFRSCPSEHAIGDALVTTRRICECGHVPTLALELELELAPGTSLTGTFSQPDQRKSRRSMTQLLEQLMVPLCDMCFVRGEVQDAAGDSRIFA